MAIVVNTKNRQRARLRPGRRVQYLPTANEVNVYGEGPFTGLIAEVNNNGTVDITVTFPAPVAGYGTLDTTYGAPELAAIVDGTVARRLQGVFIGGLAGQCSLVGPAA
jgi:hypothetical protein